MRPQASAICASEKLAVADEADAAWMEGKSASAQTKNDAAFMTGRGVGSMIRITGKCDSEIRIIKRRATIGAPRQEPGIDAGAVC